MKDENETTNVKQERRNGLKRYYRRKEQMVPRVLKVS